MAGLAAANLMPYCADAVAISMEGGNENAAYRLAAITEHDVLLAIRCRAIRWTPSTSRASPTSEERGYWPSPTHRPPLVRLAEQVLFAPADHPVLISSNTVVLALIESLVAAVMTRNKEAVKLAAELTESVLSYLHVQAEQPARAEPSASAGVIAARRDRMAIAGFTWRCP